VKQQQRQSLRLDVIVAHAEMLQEEDSKVAPTRSHRKRPLLSNRSSPSSPSLTSPLGPGVSSPGPKNRRRTHKKIASPETLSEEDEEGQLHGDCFLDETTLD